MILQPFSFSVCYQRLNGIVEQGSAESGGGGTTTETSGGDKEKQEALNEGCELETSISFESSSNTDMDETPETRTLTAISVLKSSGGLPGNAKGFR